MFRIHRKNLVLVVLFLAAALMSVTAVEAAIAKGAMVFKRAERPAIETGASELFSTASPGNRDACYGECNASSCICYGTYSCCEAGCNWCWDTFFPI